MTTSLWERRVHRALVAASEDASPTPAAPSADRIWAAVCGQLPGREARNVIDAAVLDPAAFVELRLALALVDELRPENAAQSEPGGGRPGGTVRARGWGALALAVAAALLAVLSLRPRSPGLEFDGPPSYREAPSTTLGSRIPEGAELSREAFELRWQAVEGATYDVSVSTQSAALVAHRRGIREPRLKVPTAALQSLPAGSKLLWRVEARLADGSSRRSPTFVVVVR